jgi:hypothetical protein
VQGGLGNQFREIEFDELKGFLQPRMAANLHINFLIGSGSSLPCIPTMKTTFEDYIMLAPEKFDQLFSKYTDGQSEDAAKNIELFLTWLGNRVAGLSPLELRGEDEIKQELTDDLVKSIRNGMIAGLKIEQAQDASHDREVLTTTFQCYEDFIRRIAKLRESANDQYDTVNLFTTNYDLFLESALDRLDYAYTDGFQPKLKPEFNISEYSRRPVDVARRFRDKWSIVRPFFRVYKLHGSLNWHKQGHKIIRVAEWEDNDAMVIAPTTSKYADSQGTPYSDLFRELSVELLKPDSVLLINGFSFGDEHISDLLIQALGRADFQLIAFVDDKLSSVQAFMSKVSGNTKATFVTNGTNNDAAFYFSTLTSLLAFHDPFEVPEEQGGLTDE